jgi:lysophospholipid acyltransferase (LPLAT)-like uncharacterized protein
MGSKKKKKKKKKYGLKFKIEINIACFMVWLLGKSLRWRVIGREQLDRYLGKEGFIVNAWHGQQLMGFYIFRGCGYYILSSKSRDGEISSSIMRKLGWKIIRGSSTRGGARSLIELMRVIRQGAGTVLTPDAPGPIYHIEPGGIYLAQKTGAVLIPLAFVYDRKWISEKSWDKFVVPKPFARCVAYFGTPLKVTAELTEENIEIEKRRLQDAIHKANEQGEEVLRQWLNGK